MTSHPNRSQSGPASTPTPAAIKNIRVALGLTQTDAANLIYTTCRNWQKWEQGENRMHPAFFELFLLKTS